MSSSTPTNTITSNLRPDLNLKSLLKNATSRRAGKADPSIKTFRNNIRAIGANDMETLIKFFTYFWKSLPVDPSKVDGIVAQNKDKATTAGAGNKAPITQLEGFIDQYKALMTLIVRNVSRDFMNWGILARAMEDVMQPIADKVISGGNLEDKRMVQKGFFIFFASEIELTNWLAFQISFYMETIRFILGSSETNVGNTRFEVPKSAEDWANWFNGKKVTRGSRVATKQARRVFKDFVVTVNDRGGNLASISPADMPNIDDRLEIMALVQPGRFMGARDQIKNNGGEVSSEWVDQIIAMFTPLNNLLKRNFNLKAVDKTIENGADLNESYRETVSVARGLVSQYRTRRYGGNNVRLLANQSRKVRGVVKVKLA